MRFKMETAVLAIYSSLFLGFDRAAADGPAVSEMHPLVGASFTAVGTGSRDVQAILAEGVLYAPVGESFGLGLHASAGLGIDEGDAEEAVGGGGVLFWRDPDAGYLGVEGSVLHLGDFDRWGVSALGGFYLGDWDLGGSAGYAAGVQLLFHFATPKSLKRQLREDRL